MLYDPKWEAPIAPAKPIEPWRDALRIAANLIESRGHAKGAVEDSKGRLCVVGALDKACEGRSCYIEARNALRHQIGSDIINWNNARMRTKDEVVTALRSAAIVDEAKAGNQ